MQAEPEPRCLFVCLLVCLSFRASGVCICLSAEHTASWIFIVSSPFISSVSGAHGAPATSSRGDK